MNLDDLYKQVIMDHAKNRKNYRTMESYTHKVHYKNPTCGDVMTMYTLIKDDKVEDLSFVGEGCFISMASSSMFTTIAKDKKVEEIKELSKLMQDMIINGIKIEDSRLEEAISLKDIHKLPARYNCALMPWQAFDKLLKIDPE
ncbi:Fe-S cluster assembly sulfur transfer protein SufU [Priestia megaterium]|nr:SUF system NifU family Fe-S cluster assembly protein [Priestia megaterium]MED3866113.1 SUF system NifU family Fe-S cluster assembly protein [Priestia megaterium]MED4101017.1 SUF system NifU family Fe-S cluster assembly protein [Priestia megaterium]MED4145430.1 SUF system NifU family Fe-S cluster assembly protein [Priestia megaterium]